MLDNSPAEYFWDLVCEQMDDDLLHGRFAFVVPPECPFPQFHGKSVMVTLTEDGDYHVFAFDTFEEAVRELRLQHVAGRSLH